MTHKTNAQNMKLHYPRSSALALLILTLLLPLRTFGDVAIINPGIAHLGQPTSLATIGYEFTVGSQPLSVEAFGIFDSGDDGLTNSHQIAIWDSSGLLLRSVTIPSGTSTIKLGEFRFQKLLQPLSLSAGEAFTIGARYVKGDADQFHTAVSPGPTFSGDIQSPVSRYRLNSFGFPTSSIGGAPYAGPNFQYKVVPEPSSSLLLGLGALVIAAFRRRN